MTQAATSKQFQQKKRALRTDRLETRGTCVSGIYNPEFQVSVHVMFEGQVWAAVGRAHFNIPQHGDVVNAKVSLA